MDIEIDPLAPGAFEVLGPEDIGRDAGDRLGFERALDVRHDAGHDRLVERGAGCDGGVPGGDVVDGRARCAGEDGAGREHLLGAGADRGRREDLAGGQADGLWGMGLSSDEIQAVAALPPNPPPFHGRGLFLPLPLAGRAGVGVLEPPGCYFASTAVVPALARAIVPGRYMSSTTASGSVKLPSSRRVRYRRSRSGHGGFRRGRRGVPCPWPRRRCRYPRHPLRSTAGCRHRSRRPAGRRAPRGRAAG